MPTGYTCVITDEPETTFEQFALRCARAFGVLVHMRDHSLDTPIPDTIEPSDFYRVELDKAYAKMRELETMSQAEAEARAAADYAHQVQMKTEGEARWQRENDLYTAMLAKVNAWEPPTAEHAGLQKFMREQIEMSMHGRYDWPIHKMSGKTWLEHEKERAADAVRRDSEAWRNEQESAKKATAWLRALRSSVSRPEEPR